MSDAAMKTRTISLPTYDGRQTAALVVEPDGPGPYPAIVFGQEAMGFNVFGLDVAQKVAALGFVTVTPDYYRGDGPANPNNYNDFSEVMAAIGALDFRRATHDLLAAADWARAQPQVDAARVGVWGYCTGASLALMAASLDRRLGAAVLFFPSQPRFEAIDARHPAHPVDMVWNIACPVMLIYGDQDPLWPPAMVDELRRRFEQWGVQHDIRCYAGAGHAFSAPAEHMHNAAAAAGSWQAATQFARRHLG